MCYTDEARPPLPPISGGAADHGDMTLTAVDGNQFGAHFARAAKPTGAGMVVMPDVRGLHRFYKELADRFAEAGVDAVAIDYFGRSAGIAERTDDFEYMPHLEKTSNENIRDDVAAGMSYLRSRDGGAVRSVFTVGFCYGGSNSFNQSALQPDVNGCIGFYGRPVRSEPYIATMRKPLLVMVAGADGATTPEQATEFGRRLNEAGVPNEQHVYAGAPHSFFDRGFVQWKDACDDAWRRMLEFVKKQS